MAKHRMADRVVEIGSLDDIPFSVKQLAAEHFERNILNNIFENTKVSNLKKYGNEEGFSQFFLYTHEQFGETNAFVLYHTEVDNTGNVIGWIDFVMVRQCNRSEGIGRKITEHAIDALKEKGCLAIFLGVLQPMSKDGEVGFPAYGSIPQLITCGFVESGSENKRVFSIEGELYNQMVFVLI